MVVLPVPFRSTSPTAVPAGSTQDTPRSTQGRSSAYRNHTSSNSIPRTSAPASRPGAAAGTSWTTVRYWPNNSRARYPVDALSVTAATVACSAVIAASNTVTFPTASRPAAAEYAATAAPNKVTSRSAKR